MQFSLMKTTQNKNKKKIITNVCAVYKCNTIFKLLFVANRITSEWTSLNCTVVWKDEKKRV